MSVVLHTLKYWVLAIFIVSTLFIHFRGRVRHSFIRQFGDHSTFVAPLNVLLYLFSNVPNRPFIPVERFPELAPLKEHWHVIREEALALMNRDMIRTAQKYNDLGFNSFFKTGWGRFYLKWYGTPPQSAQELCPKTIALIEQVPSLRAAMFTVLPPGARLVRHRDPFAGSLRYHLGLSTPNAEDCYIEVDGERYAYFDGKDVVFDETYIHYAENKTQTPRLIFFADIERPVKTGIVRAINHFMANHVMPAASTENVPGEKVGVLNKLFGVIYPMRLWGKKLKARSRVAYYTLKWALIVALLYWIFH